MHDTARRFIAPALAILATSILLLAANVSIPRSVTYASANTLATPTRRVYLPLIVGSGPNTTSTETSTPSPEPSATATPTRTPVSPTSPPTGGAVRQINAPNFNNSEINYASTAVLWLGKINSQHNYADVRIGYNNQKLYVSLNVVDRTLWYNSAAASDALTNWDAATLYLNLDQSAVSAPGTNTFRLDGQLNWWEPRTGYQAAYRGNGTGWSPANVAFSTTTGWRGNAPNDTLDDTGWRINYEIPFASLGLAGPPPKGTKWGLGVAVHDRDLAAATAPTTETWPEALLATKPSTWGQIAFGLPIYQTPQVAATGSVKIRQGLNGSVVPDAAVGGTMENLCGETNGLWDEWGNRNFAGAPRFNIQNQEDVADWWCFSKYYVTFPLDQIPPGKVIVSASLTLHEFGNSGQPNLAAPSLIQVFTLDKGWNETTLTWNNAPLPRENVSQAWVNPIATFPGWPGVPWSFDLSRAAAEAYAAGTPLRLVLYEADAATHSGKYFTGSDEPDWNEAARPTLDIVWGNP